MKEGKASRPDLGGENDEMPVDRKRIQMELIDIDARRYGVRSGEKRPCYSQADGEIVYHLKYWFQKQEKGQKEEGRGE